MTGWPRSSGEIVRDRACCEHLLSGLPLGNRSGFDGAFADGDGAATDRRTGEPTVRRSFLLCDFFKPLIQDDFYIKNGRSVAMYWVQPTCCRLLKMRVP